MEINISRTHHICRVFEDGSQSEYTLERDGENIEFKHGDDWIIFPAQMVDAVITALSNLASLDVQKTSKTIHED